MRSPFPRTITRRNKVSPKMFRMRVKLFGEPAEMVALREEMAEAASKQSDLEQQIQSCQEEKLEWRAKESTVRKELQDCQERTDELLEQVVRLTHQKRDAAKDLLEQKFKTEATPLERNRFEMELDEARGKVRRAEDRAKEAEERLARNQDESQALKRLAARAKKLESDQAWSKQQSAALLRALGAAVDRIRMIEATSAEREGDEQAKRAYKRPTIRKARKTLVAKYEALAQVRKPGSGLRSYSKPHSSVTLGSGSKHSSPGPRP